MKEPSADCLTYESILSIYIFEGIEEGSFDDSHVTYMFLFTKLLAPSRIQRYVHFLLYNLLWTDEDAEYVSL